MVEVRSLIGAIFLALALVGPALAHSWYDHDCCSDRDCAPVSLIEPAEGGEWMTSKFGRVFVPANFPKERQRPSHDADTHVCIMAPVHDEMTGEKITGHTPLCVYRPMGS